MERKVFIIRILSVVWMLIGSMLMNQWSDRRRGRYIQNLQQKQKTVFPTSSRIWTSDPSNQAVAALSLRPHVHRNRNMLTLKRPPWVKYDPKWPFFPITFLCMLQWHQLSWLCYDKCNLGRHSGFVLLVIIDFLKFWFSLSGVRFGARWPCVFCFSVFSFVHFCGDNVL